MVTHLRSVQIGRWPASPALVMCGRPGPGARIDPRRRGWQHLPALRPALPPPPRPSESSQLDAKLAARPSFADYEHELAGASRRVRQNEEALIVDSPGQMAPRGRPKIFVTFAFGRRPVRPRLI